MEEVGVNGEREGLLYLREKRRDGGKAKERLVLVLSGAAEVARGLSSEREETPLVGTAQ